MRDFQVTSGGNRLQALSSIVLAFFLTLGLLLLMGLDRGTYSAPPKNLVVRQVPVTPPPPPPREHPQVQRKINTTQIPNLKISKTQSSVVLKTPPLDLKLQMELPTQSSLKDLKFNVDLDEMTGEALSMVFKFSDLDQAPKLLHCDARFIFPRDLTRRGIRKGVVMIEIEISTDGKASFIAVESASHPQLIPIAKRLISSSRFSPSTLNGEAVTARGTWPVHIQAPRK